MTPPIHDREQAVEIVQAVSIGYRLSPLQAAEIVDALGIETSDSKYPLLSQAMAEGRVTGEGRPDPSKRTLRSGQPDPEVGPIEPRTFHSQREVAQLRERAERAEERLRDALRPIEHLLEGWQAGGCREELGEEANFHKCWAPADFVLWGKLISPEGLGPRCYDHAAKHLGHSALADSDQTAIIDLRPLRAVLSVGQEQGQP